MIGPPAPASPPGDTERFRALFDGNYRRLLAYARRRCPSAADADDLVAEVFTVAWRRLADVPAGDAATLWLYGTARRCLANQARGSRRRLRLVARLAAERPDGGAPAAGAAAVEVRAALDRLRPTDREVLRLVAWEGLTHAEAAVVLGVSPNAVAIRVHRAKRRLARALGGAGGRGGAKGTGAAGQERGAAPEDRP